MASKISEQDVRPAIITDAMRRYVFEDFKAGGFARASGTPFGNPTGTTGDVNYWHTRMNTFQYHVLGTQTILAPVLTATGLNITQDLTSGDGVEWTLGCEEPANTVVSARNQASFTIGTDPPFGAYLSFNLTDVSGTDDCAFGFRKSEQYQALIDDYNDMAVLNSILGTIKVETILANAATVTTSTKQSWADTETHSLAVYVDSDGTMSGTVGNVYYLIDGAAPTFTAAPTQFAFASGTVVIPFFYFLNAADIAEVTVLKQWESGLLGPGNLIGYKAQ